MGVVTKYGNGYRNPASLSDHPGEYAEGRPRVISGTVAVASGDSATSKHYWGKLPSSAIVHPSSVLYHGSITTLEDYDLGLEHDGQLVSLDLLADGLNLASAGSKSPIANVAAASYHKRLWELLQLPHDPGRIYDLVGTMKAAATASSFISLFFMYLKR